MAPAWSSTSTVAAAPAAPAAPAKVEKTTPLRVEDGYQKRRMDSVSPDPPKRSKRRTSADNESSSAESTSESDSSSSGDSDRERQQLVGSSALKLHGVIHDLMLELERTRTKHAKYSDKVKAASKKIRDISRKLERRFRHLSESAMTAAPVADRPSSTRRTSVPINNNMDRSSYGSHIRNPVTVTTTKRSQPQPQFPMQSQLNASRQVQPQREQNQQPQAAIADRERGRTRNRSRTRLAAHNDRITVASSNVVETFTNVHADIRSKAFTRKPRNMVLHSPIAGSDMEEVMVTSSLEGSVVFWDLEGRHAMSTIPKGHLNQPWSEDMCWVGQNTLALASAHKEGVPTHHQLTLVHVEKVKSHRSALGGDSVSWSLQPLKESPHEGSKGGIVCVSALTQDASGISLATAGVDKQIIKWRFTSQNNDGECAPLGQDFIHNRHTSLIQALCYAPQSDMLLSGGCDCKVIGYDMVRSEVVLEYKNRDGRINSIAQNPVDPNLFLICQATTSNQLLLHDKRTRFDIPVLHFGFDSADRLSRQVQPSWHPGGAIVSCGMNIESKINIWDIRWKDVHRGAGQSVDVHDKRVFKAAFHPKRSLMTSMSADGGLGFIDFCLNPDTVVHR
ncbi:hypothetical protein EDD11_001288 [Mortierella claussenii]|nr:hypothetical protein EDD11_001288 [Mortierella claussenii]